jgi:hypothetical protein
VKNLQHTSLPPKQPWCNNLNTKSHKQFQMRHTESVAMARWVVLQILEKGKAGEEIRPSIEHLLAGVFSKSSM